MSSGQNRNNGQGRTLSGIPKTMLRLLADGQPHNRAELLACIPNELSDTMAYHLTQVRYYVRPFGFEIICRIVNRGKYWQLARLTPELSRQMLSKIESYTLNE